MRRQPTRPVGAIDTHRKQCLPQMPRRPKAAVDVDDLAPASRRAPILRRAYSFRERRFDFSLEGDYFNSLSNEVKYTFQVVGLREQIDQVGPFNPVASFKQTSQVAGEGSRIA